jgi:ligand-binding sensor domain-containing protein
MMTDRIILQAWQSEDGLPHQLVNSVLQDRQGFIWLATETALVRFDGVQFKEYSSPLIGNERSWAGC